MWNKTWTMKEGFIIGGAFIAVGLLLEWLSGPVDWTVLRWPVNGIAMGVFVVLLVGLYLCRRRSAFIRSMMTLQAAVPALAYTIALTLIMGLTRQDGAGPRLHDMLTFWPFVLVYVWLTAVLGLVTVRRVAHFGAWRRDVPFVLNHLGLFIALTTATLGSADIWQLKMITVQGDRQWRAVTQERRVVELSMGIELKRFILETYDDGSPRRFASEIEVLTKEGECVAATVDVNHPAKVNGWKIYQYGYDTAQGAASEISILELVRDPWLPWVYGGIYMMLAGAVALFFSGRSRAIGSGRPARP